MNGPLLDNFTLILIIIIGSLLLIAGIVVIIIFASKKKKLKTVNSGPWLEALGNKDNILDVSVTGSRVSLILNDQELIDREKLKTLGVTSVVIMSNKVILVIKDKAEVIANAIKGEL